MTHREKNTSANAAAVFIQLLRFARNICGCIPQENDLLETHSAVLFRKVMRLKESYLRISGKPIRSRGKNQFYSGEGCACDNHCVFTQPYRCAPEKLI